MRYNLYKEGFQKFVLKKKEFKKLNKIKFLIKKVASNVTKKKILKVETFHKQIKTSENFNNIKLKIISEINKKNFNELIFFILKEKLIKVFGPDIAVQKKINLVIQRPFDQNYVTLHKDSPPNSPYELVVWIPLMDCKKTNAFKFLKIKDSKKINDMFNDNISEKKIKHFAQKKAISLETNFGEYIIFWTGVYHFSGLNEEKSTRWSLNLRYKNLFSPYGAKGYLDFFQPINYSELTDLNLNS